MAYEILLSMKTLRIGKESSMTIKLDISKANGVEWKFPEHMMHSLGFDERWITMITTCVTSTSYSVLLNGQSGFTFQPNRELRQGDFISPYLYLLCEEGLNSLFYAVIHGIKISQGSLPLYHLFFAEDSLVFYRATHAEWLQV